MPDRIDLARPGAVAPRVPDTISEDMQDDLIQSFQVEGAGVRGRLVRLGPALDNILGKHDYPEPVAMLLAQALTLAATLASALKFDGVFTLQTKGNGPVSMLVADYRTPGRLRGYASFDRAALDALPAQAGPVGAVPRLLGAGYLAFTVDQGEDTERYQGIVELAGATLADCVHNYFQQSEQLKAGIRLGVSRHADAGGEPHWHAGGLMIQRLPQEGGIQGEGSLLGVAPDDDEAADDAWRRALLMVGSVRDRELTDTALPPNDLLYRLFHEDGVRVWTPQTVQEGCTCSAGRVAGVLRSFAPEEIEEMVVDGRVTARCEFCNTSYDFAPADLLGGRDGLDGPEIGSKPS